MSRSRFMILRGISVLLVLIASAYAWGDSPCDPPAWWDHFPRVVEASTLAAAQAYHATVAMNSAATDPGWGTFGQQWSFNPTRLQAFAVQGIRSASYNETFGQSYCYIAQIGLPLPGQDLNQILYSHWSWYWYLGGGPIEWVGAKNWYDDETFARPYTRTHSLYGGPPMRYPDGTIATGYNGPSSDPRNHRVYDAGCSKNILGQISYEPVYNTMVNNINPATGQPYGPLTGLLYIPADNKYTGLIMFHKDSACPHWNDYTYASTYQAVREVGLQASWTDNFGDWDSFNRRPVERGFGDWSVVRFRDYLAAHFTPAQLTAMGVTNLATFDIREKFKQIAAGWGWDGVNLNHSVWESVQWQNEPLWLAYTIYKRQIGTEALAEYYHTMKQAAQDGGLAEDFLIMGNDSDTIGWGRGLPDLVCTELTVNWNLISGPRGFMLPPVGRLAPCYKATRESARSHFISLWLYNSGAETVCTNPNLCWTLFSEMLANHALPKFDESDPDGQVYFGNSALRSEFLSFVADHQADFGLRQPLDDVGIVYSTSTNLHERLPGNINGFDDTRGQLHLYAIWGWGTALGEMQYQYRMIPDWKLTAEALSSLKVLIVPEAEVFDANEVNTLITPWVQNGGLLLVTGISGNRSGENGNFAVYPGGYSFQTLTTISNKNTAPSQLLRSVGNGRVLYVRDNIGLTFYQNDAAVREILRSQMAVYMQSLLQGRRPMVVTPGNGCNSHVGITVFEDQCAGKLFADVINYNITVANDIKTPTAELVFTVQKPYWLLNKPYTARVISPTTVPTLTVVSPTSATLEVHLGPVLHYASVVLEAELSPDINRDQRINLGDFALLSGQWGIDDTCYAPNDWCQGTDLNRNHTPDLADLAILGELWLTTTP